MSAIGKLSSKKILLTGEADYQLATTAFNEGIIDCFIRKDSVTIVEDIISHLKKLTYKYFADNTKQLLAYLETDYSLPLSDPEFIAFFKNWCQQNKITEHYLIDKCGNLLLTHANGEKSYFILHTDRTLNSFIELHQDDKETTSFIRAVKQREKIPFFGEGVEGWQLQSYQWASCFYTPQKIIGSQTYYWAIAEAA